MVVMPGAVARREAVGRLFERLSGRDDAGRDRDLDRDRQQSPPPPMPTELQAAAEHGASALAMGSNQIPDEVAGVVIESTEDLCGNDDECALAFCFDFSIFSIFRF